MEAESKELLPAMEPHMTVRPTPSCLLTAVILWGGASIVCADTLTDIRYNDLVTRLGIANVPTGVGIGIGQVEAPEGANYAPDTLAPYYAGTTFTLLNGASATSGHANTVAFNLCGDASSVAPGLSNVWNYNANGWVGSSWLRVGQGSALPPLAAPATHCKVWNNSWIGSFGSTTNDNDGIRRLDWAMNRDGALAVSGTNNGAGSAAQPLMAYCFNGLTVGIASGGHSNGLTPTGIDGPNRRKPDLVAPGDFTSFSTPVVASCAAMLFDEANDHPNLATNANASKGLTIKAAMLAGTTHRSSWSNGAPQSGVNRGSTATPLDALYGADLLNVDRAHRILTAGEQSGFATPQASSFSAGIGWDYVPTLVAATSVYYTFHLSGVSSELSVTASWNRLVASTFASYTLLDCDLRLWKLEGSTLVSINGDAGATSFASGNCESNSLIDNAEHLYMKGVAPGDYVLQVSRKAGTQTTLPVCVAWYIDPSSLLGDLNGDGLVGPGDLSMLLNNWGANGMGDLNGDAIVGAADLAILLGAWNS